MVVHDEYLHRQLVDCNHSKFLHGHLETAVAYNGCNHLVGTSDLGTDSCREAEAHGAGSARGEPLVRIIGLVILGCPHLVLAYICGHNGLALGKLEKLLHHMGNLDLGSFFIFKREILLKLLYALAPGFGIPLCTQAAEDLHDALGLAHDSYIHLDGLIDLRGIHIYVDLDCIAAECCRGAGDTVVPPGADGHNQVAFLQSLVGIGGAMHACHAQRQRACLWEHTFAQQRACHRNLHFLGKGAHRLTGARYKGAVAYQQHRPLGVNQVVGSSHHLAQVGLPVQLVARQVAVVRGVNRYRELGHVLGYVDEDWARTAGAGDYEGLLHYPRNIGGFLY